MVKNLLSTLLAVLLGLVIALVLSVLLNMFLNKQAYEYLWGSGGSIDTARLVEYAAFRNGCMIFGATFGFIAAQVTYILDRLQQKQPS